MFEYSAPHIFVKKRKPKPSEVFETYWRFACRRQDVFFSRLEDLQGPWTSDPILSTYKFTNAYRASDRVSQYLIKNVIYSSDWSARDTVFRTLLFKVFNKIETWELLERQVGEICLDTFCIRTYAQVLEAARQNKKAIYSAAYIMPSGSGREYKGMRKHQFHLELLKRLIDKGFVERLLLCETMEMAFNEILAVESFGKFLAYQFVTDLNYSEYFKFSEDEFVVPGPGALDGIKKCFTELGDYSEPDVIKLMMDEQHKNFDMIDESFKSLWGRSLQLIDCQNLFCEVDKYARVAHPDISGLSGRTRIKQKFKLNSEPLHVWYPPKWKINNYIEQNSMSDLAVAM